MSCYCHCVPFVVLVHLFVVAFHFCVVILRLFMVALHLFVVSLCLIVFVSHLCVVSLCLIVVVLHLFVVSVCLFVVSLHLFVVSVCLFVVLLHLFCSQFVSLSHSASLSSQFVSHCGCFASLCSRLCLFEVVKHLFVLSLCVFLCGCLCLCFFCMSYRLCVVSIHVLSVCC